LNVFDAVDAAFGGPGKVRHVAIEIPATGNGQYERYCNDSHNCSPKLIVVSLSLNADFAYAVIIRSWLPLAWIKEGMWVELRLPDARGLVGICRLWEANLRGFGAPALGVEEGELGGDLDPARGRAGGRRLEEGDLAVGGEGVEVTPLDIPEQHSDRGNGLGGDLMRRSMYS
jgi:hypothetical protein